MIFLVTHIEVIKRILLVTLRYLWRPNKCMPCLSCLKLDLEVLTHEVASIACKLESHSTQLRHRLWLRRHRSHSAADAKLCYDHLHIRAYSDSQDSEDLVGGTWTIFIVFIVVNNVGLFAAAATTLTVGHLQIFQTTPLPLSWSHPQSQRRRAVSSYRSCLSGTLSWTRGRSCSVPNWDLL